GRRVRRARRPRVGGRRVPLARAQLSPPPKTATPPSRAAPVHPPRTGTTASRGRRGELRRAAGRVLGVDPGLDLGHERLEVVEPRAVVLVAVERRVRPEAV